MQYFLNGENVGLLTCRQQSTFDFQHVFVSNVITDMSAVSLQTSETTYVFPLYLYAEQATLDNARRTPNLDARIVAEICQRTGLRFADDNHPATGGELRNTFAPIDLLDYIYAVLHSPSYREKYKEFLKIDFPRVPYPDDAKAFWKLAKLGERLRRLHLMEGVEPPQGLANYGVSDNGLVTNVKYASGKVWINDTQYFDNVLPEVWNFYIGGYQPAQKWLKDRKERTLTFEEIQHYQKIVAVLNETIEIMNERDK
jgi:predicted helicase